MTRLEAFLTALAVMVLPSAKGRHHGVAQAAAIPAEPVPDDAPTVSFSRLTSHPYPSQETR